MNETQLNEYRCLHEAYQFLYKKFIGNQIVEVDFYGMVNPFMKVDDSGWTANKNYEKKVNDIVDKQMQDDKNKALEKQLEEEKRTQNELNQAWEKNLLEEKRKLRVSVGDDDALARRASLEAEAAWQQEIQKAVEDMDKKGSSKKKKSKKTKKEKEDEENSSIRKAEQKFLDSVVKTSG